MSNKYPMVATDKCEMKLTVPVETKIKMGKMLVETRKSTHGLIDNMNQLANSIFDKAVADMPWTEADEKRRCEIIKANEAKRAEKKAEKGIK